MSNLLHFFKIKAESQVIFSFFVIISPKSGPFSHFCLFPQGVIIYSFGANSNDHQADGREPSLHVQGHGRGFR